MKHATGHLGNLAFLIIATFFFSSIQAHEASSLTESSVDRMNGTIQEYMLEVQTTLSGIFQGVHTSTTWPDPEILNLRDEMLHLLEDAELSLEYLAGDGVNLRSPDLIKTNPLAGRALAASQGINTAMTLLKHVISLENQDSLTKEIYSGGLSAQMYNLVGAHREKMQLYEELIRLNKLYKPEQDSKT